MDSMIDMKGNRLVPADEVVLIGDFPSTVKGRKAIIRHFGFQRMRVSIPSVTKGRVRWVWPDEVLKVGAPGSEWW